MLSLRGQAQRAGLKKDSLAAAKMFVERSQGAREKTADFAAELKKLFKQAYPCESATSTVLLQRFVTGISRQLLLQGRPEDLEGAVKAALAIKYRGGSGTKEVVRPTIVAYCRRWCPEVLCVLAEARSADLSAQSAGENFSHVFLERSRSIQMAVLGKKRPWLLWSFNGRPTTRTRNRCHC